MQSDKEKPSVSGNVPDAQKNSWVERFAPAFSRPYLRLARLDRPIGFWLLFWPCAMALALSAVARPPTGFNGQFLALFFIGAIVMRGAGCTFNDLVDQGLDEKVARTRLRPLPSGQVSRFQAMLFLIAQLLVGLVVLLQFNRFAIWLGIGSLALVAIYPFMKRITWWPQLFLGLVFSWGALMGWAAEFGQLFKPAYLLYAGSVLWVIGYDTIYALMDTEDDALIGIKSTALLFGRHARLMVALFYLGASVLWVWAGWSAGAGNLFLMASLLPGSILLWQVATLKPDNVANCLTRFRANHYVGLALTLALWIEFRF